MRSIKWWLAAALCICVFLLVLARDSKRSREIRSAESQEPESVARLDDAVSPQQTPAPRPLPVRKIQAEEPAAEAKHHADEAESDTLLQSDGDPSLERVRAQLEAAFSGAQEYRPPRRDSKTFDLNRDGAVSPDEQERADELSERATQFASNWSSAGSYPILADEFYGGERFFAAMDQDGDGALTEREALNYFVDSIRELRRYDQNADGALALAEFGHLESRFNYLDTNSDGKIEAWEINILRGRGTW
ncbi:MAG: hypothetical protein AAFY60_21110 [Myxococcota bacterium]